tara:strand:- start:169388 stop:170071 length:684 start_codon:yes stop_codon:yes gene_type:complete
VRVLVVDTALSLCTAAVFEGGRPLAVRSEVMLKGHQERLAGLVAGVVAEAGGGFEAVDRIGVTTGPGSFTGLRVGLAFAQGLGTALNRPVVGISTLDALAASVDATSDDADVVALIDARRGQVYARFWCAGTATGPAQALSLEAAGGRLATLAPGATLVGSGAILMAEGATDAVIADLSGPTPAGLARLVAAADPAAAPARPEYLRAPDATPPTRLPGRPRSPVKDK